MMTDDGGVAGTRGVFASSALLASSFDAELFVVAAACGAAAVLLCCACLCLCLCICCCCCRRPRKRAEHRYSQLAQEGAELAGLESEGADPFAKPSGNTFEVPVPSNPPGTTAATRALWPAQKPGPDPTQAQPAWNAAQLQAQVAMPGQEACPYVYLPYLAAVPGTQQLADPVVMYPTAPTPTTSPTPITASN
eukprot:TRINITY_DN4191_c0_g1_i2.p2 TRINITY_DN4191_c0_g1~~TRINITY_DN4191_c0_g1_i2.p2  ORF type:complete len:205 (-),score=52.07 TRINITY_DN4191_c0_g1_i2:73-651(-)